uniref:Uncharacterized protein n=1 Tax=Tanacetum cinerariifolium TaxID=118510 RepID=A0A699KVL7_TANCI|nr:hypothetical protein [Tanacetum cinerariifolium]
MMFFKRIDQRIPFTISGTRKRVVYLNQHNIKSFMKLSEVKKFCDCTLNKIRENLVDMVKRNKLGTSNKRLKGRDCTNMDVEKSIEIVNKIDKVLKRREQLRRVEEYVGGRPKTVNPRTFNSSTPTQQDDLILSVIEQLKTQVVNCTKINQNNKNVNEILTAEPERYKNQVRILKGQNNVDKASASCAQSLEIDNLKHILSEHLKENKSLEQKVKELNNIVFKRNQSTQTVHMLTKPQFFYDHSTRQALGFQNPCYLKKAQQLEPKLYDGSVIQKTNAIVIRNSEETLMLEDESRSKFIQKQKDPMMSETKVNTKLVDC